MKFEKLSEVIISKGLLKAMGKQLKYKAVCGCCGYIMPSYPGKYSKCPLCQGEIVKPKVVASPVEDPNAMDGGDLVVDPETPEEKEKTDVTNEGNEAATMKLYAHAAKAIFSTEKAAEKWLDKNATKLSMNVKNSKEAQAEIQKNIK